MIVDLEKQVNLIHHRSSDINEHIPTIIELAQECDHITEMGCRWVVSTWAWLAGLPKNGLVTYDILNPMNWTGEHDVIKDVEDTAKAYNIDFKFIEADVCAIEIEETDLLFLDTWHSYKQLTSELKLHASKVKKYICFHDTTSYATKDETNYEEWGDEWKAEGIGIWKAIEEFLESNPEWVLEKRFTNNNGFTIIKRIK